jgi:CubicO group peptidase (beta-lactamase class C family)
MSQSSDWLSFALALPMAHPPGTIWTYNGCCLTLLAHQIAVKSGTNFPQYADKYLLGPLGIGNKEWVNGPRGANRVDYGLYWKARDWAKLGQLYLNKGKWEGKRIVSAAWVKDATTVHAPQGQAFGHDYGYLWHIKSFQWKDRTIRVFFANGYMGQEIFVSPDADLVCIMTASSQSPLIYTLEEDLFENVILASFN